MSEGMEITYSLNRECGDYSTFVQQLILDRQAKKICDVGGGANPLIPLKFINDNSLDYTILDISRAELEKAPEVYSKLVIDIEAEQFNVEGQYDFVVSRMMAEHIKKGMQFHKNVFMMLKPGGVAVHFFPTLFALPFLINQIVPERFSSILLNFFFPRDRYQTAKFPAYYNWCYGPIPSMVKMLQGIGYEIILFNGIFGHWYYTKIPGLRQAHEIFSDYLIVHPNPYLTSYALVILRKPEGAIA
jgi:hypothetical protein